jgi:ABC-type multidrug transport system fused ATPase/permease subunit
MLWQYAAGLIGVILSFSSPYYLFQIVRKVSDPSADRLSVIPLILGLFACNCGKTICDGQMYFIGRRIGTRARVIIIDELYKKSLHRVQGASADDEKASLGKIVTLMSVDAEAIREFLSYSSEFLFNLPLSIVISISSLYFVMGWSAFVGVALVGLIGPISSKLAGWMVKYQKILLENTDNRVSLVNEMLQGIRIVKYFAWEHLWIKRVTEAREKELKSFMDLFKVYIAFGVLGSGSSIVITFATFAVYTLVAGNTLDAATAFTAVNLLTVVNNQLAYLPAQVAHVFKAKVSLDRIADYLKEQDIDKYTKKLENVTEPVGVIGFKNAELKYHGGDEADANSGNFTLRDLEVEFQIGKLSVVAGSTGSGKSSLILGLLGGINRINLEMKLESGEIMFPSGKNRKVDPFTGLSQTVAYCAQNAWLLNATIRDNILFGEPYDEKRYNSVIRGCALAKDLENLDGGDLTEIGEKGINVSGGQKQRISLARACYSKSSFVLLDDPLSAVDAPTARFLLHKCILGLLKGRTVILVSHATNLVVPFADRVVVMKNGEICAQGTPYEITNHATDETVKGLSLELDIFDNEKEGYSEDDGQIAATIAGGGTGLVQKEEKATGSVKLSLYKYYLVSAGGFVFAFFFVSSFGLTQGSQFIMDFWLKIWTDSTKVNHFSINTMSFNPEYSSDTTTYSNLWMQPHSKTIFSSLNAPEHPPLYYIGVYAILGVFVVIANQLQTLVYLLGSLWASKKIHAELLTAILYSPLRFFEITPIGRVLNRFSKDIGQIDNDVLGAIDFFIMKVVQGVTIIVIIATIEPLFLVIMPFIAYVYIQVAQLYLLTSRELKRIEANSRSPIYAQFSETLAGVSTLRAYGAEKRFEKLNEQKMNENHQPFFFIWGANRWLSVRTDIISAYVVLCAGFVIVFADVNAGWAAILLSYSMQFTNALLWGVRMHAEMEMNMNSGILFINCS